MTLIITQNKDLIFPGWGSAMDYLRENGFKSLEISATGYTAWSSCGFHAVKVEVLK
jgi:hypothetical protein